MCKLSVTEKLNRGMEYLGDYRSEKGFFTAVKELESNTNRVNFRLGDASFIGLDQKPTDELMWNIYKSGGFAVKVDGRTYRLSAKAESDMAQRLGITGPTLSELPKSSLAKILGICRNQFAGKEDSAMLVQIGEEGKAYAVLSDGYRVIPADQVFHEAARPIHKMGGEFSGGYLTVDNFFAEYVLRNPEIVDAYKKRLGSDFRAVPVVSIETSNTGMSSVSITPKFRLKGNQAVVIGRSIDAVHKGSVSMDKVKENCGQIFAIFQEAINGLAKMKEVKVKYPKQCFKNVAKRAGMSKPYSLMALADFEGEVLEDEETEVSAFDIYVGLTEAIFHAVNDGKPKSFVDNLTEQTARVLTLDFSKYDMPYAEWDK